MSRRSSSRARSYFMTFENVNNNQITYNYVNVLALEPEVTSWPKAKHNSSSESTYVSKTFFCLFAGISGSKYVFHDDILI